MGSVMKKLVLILAIAALSSACAVDTGPRIGYNICYKQGGVGSILTNVVEHNTLTVSCNNGDLLTYSFVEVVK